MVEAHATAARAARPHGWRALRAACAPSSARRPRPRRAARRAPRAAAASTRAAALGAHRPVARDLGQRGRCRSPRRRRGENRSTERMSTPFAVSVPAMPREQPRPVVGDDRQLACSGRRRGRATRARPASRPRAGARRKCRSMRVRRRRAQVALGHQREVPLDLGLGVRRAAAAPRPSPARPGPGAAGDRVAGQVLARAVVQLPEQRRPSTRSRSRGRRRGGRRRSAAAAWFEPLQAARPAPAKAAISAGSLRSRCCESCDISRCAATRNATSSAALPVEAAGARRRAARCFAPRSTWPPPLPLPTSCSSRPR